MSTITMNKTGYKAFPGTERKISLKERFQNYVIENSAIIFSGLTMLNGGNAYNVYKMLSR